MTASGILIPLNNKPELIQGSGTFVCGGCEIDAGGLDGGMTEHIGEADDVPVFLVKLNGEEMTQVVGKDFCFGDVRNGAEAFHLGPDLISCAGFSTHGAENGAVGDFIFASVAAKLALECAGEKDGTDLSFEGDVGADVGEGFCGDMAKLADADACGADGFDDESELVLADAIGSADESVVVVEAEGAVAVAKEGALNTQIFDAAVCDICETKIAVEGGEHGVDGTWGVAFFLEMGAPGEDVCFAERALIQPEGKAAQATQIFFRRGSAALFLNEPVGVIRKLVEDGV